MGVGGGAVGDHDHRAALGAEGVEEVEHGGGVVGVEVPRRLVGEQHRGPVDQGAGDGGALALPGRELRRPMARPLREADAREGLRGGAGGGGLPVGAPGKAHVFRRVEVGDEVEGLEDEPDLRRAEEGAGPDVEGVHVGVRHAHRPAPARAQHGAGREEQRRLAAAARAAQDHELARPHVERGAIEGVYGAPARGEGVADRVEVNHRLIPPPAGRRPGPASRRERRG